MSTIAAANPDVLQDGGRLETMRSLIDSGNDTLEAIVHLARDVAGTENAALNFVTDNNVIALAKVGPQSDGSWRRVTERAEKAVHLMGFCPYVVTRRTVICVPDTLVDPEWCDHPVVTGQPFVRRYLGAPIIVDDRPVGALCVFDRKTTTFGRQAAQQMSRLSSLAADFLANRRAFKSERALVDCIPDAWGVTDEDLNVIDVNEAMCVLLQLPRQEIVGRHAIDFVAPSEIGEWLKASAKTGGLPVNEFLKQRTTLRRTDGGEVPVNLWLRVWERGAGRRITGIVRRADVPLKQPGVSARQNECLRWAAAGKTDAEIAMLLGIAPSTVHNHIEAAKRTLGVSTRVQAILKTAPARRG